LTIQKLYAYCSSGSMPWLHCQKRVGLNGTVFGSVFIQLYAAKCTLSAARPFSHNQHSNSTVCFTFSK